MIMKSSKEICLILGLVICNLVSFSQTTVSQSDFINKELLVAKLVINEEDKSDNLAKITITKDQWVEYDHQDNIIGVAKILKVSDNMIKIEWKQADNGANVGDVTIYNVSIKDKKLHFNIHFDGSNKGYFEVNL